MYYQLFKGIILKLTIKSLYYIALPAFLILTGCSATTTSKVIDTPKVNSYNTVYSGMLNAGEREDILASVETFFGRQKPLRTTDVDSSGAYVTIGTGSQILRDLGVTQMRLLSSPMKFTGISGFNLEVTEYIPFKH